MSRDPNRAQAHRSKAERNERICRELVDRYPDWSATVAFYAALHLIGQYSRSIADEDIDLVSHAQTIDWIRKRKELRSIAEAYTTLMHFAQQARYECLRESHDLLNPERVRVKVFPLVGQVKHCVDVALKRLEAPSG